MDKKNNEQKLKNLGVASMSTAFTLLLSLFLYLVHLFQLVLCDLLHCYSSNRTRLQEDADTNAHSVITETGRSEVEEGG